MAEWATMSPEDEAREEADMNATSCIPCRRIKTCLARPLSRANAADRVRSAALMVLEPKQAPIPAMQLSYSYDVYTSDQPISKGKGNVGTTSWIAGSGALFSRALKTHTSDAIRWDDAQQEAN